MKAWRWILKAGNSCEGSESGLYLEITTAFLSSSEETAEVQDDGFSLILINPAMQHWLLGAEEGTLGTDTMITIFLCTSMNFQHLEEHQRPHDGP